MLEETHTGFVTPTTVARTELSKAIMDIIDNCRAIAYYILGPNASTVTNHPRSCVV